MTAFPASFTWMTAYCPLCGCTGWHWDGCDNTAHTFDLGRLAETSEARSTDLGSTSDGLLDQETIGGLHMSYGKPTPTTQTPTTQAGA